MSFWDRIRSAAARFMYGRNGVDALNWALFLGEMALSLLSRLIPNKTVSFLLYAVSFALAIGLIFRLFSRDLARRRAENEKFLRWWAPKRDALRGLRARRADRTHKYVKCACGAICRVPKGVGTIEMTCPKCGRKRTVKT